MHVVHQTCAGMDVHKKDIKVCLVTHDYQGQRQEERRKETTRGARERAESHSQNVSRVRGLLATKISS